MCGHGLASVLRSILRCRDRKGARGLEFAVSTYDACRSIVMTWLQPAVVSMLAISLALYNILSGPSVLFCQFPEWRTTYNGRSALVLLVLSRIWEVWYHSGDAPCGCGPAYMRRGQRSVSRQVHNCSSGRAMGQKVPRRHVQAWIMINSSISPSLMSPGAVDWMTKTSSSRTDSPTVTLVSWFE